MASTKRVNEPFNEKVRARIFGAPMNTMMSSSTSSSTSSCSGSEHDAEYDVVSPSPCLSHLVLNFLEDESSKMNDQSTPFPHEYGSDSDTDDFSRSDPTVLINHIINPTVRNNADSFKNQLLVQVTRACEIFSIFKKNTNIFHRNLMAYLRELGYNAGVCKAKWASSGNLTAGNHEFLDVVSDNHVRYIIDVNFSNEFTIARESESYKKLRNSLPKIFIGKPEDTKRVLRIICDEARRSMKISGLTLPPWRKNRYMQMKWLGPYRRSTTHLPAPVGPSQVVSGFQVKCRAVGFDVAGDGGRFLLPPVTRSR